MTLLPTVRSELCAAAERVAEQPSGPSRRRPDFARGGHFAPGGHLQSPWPSSCCSSAEPSGPG